MGLETTLLGLLYVLLVGGGLLALYLARAERVPLSPYVVGALIAGLAALMVVALALLLLTALNPG